MAEKTQKATPKRRQEARKKGQVFKSQELVNALLLLSFVAILKLWVPMLIDQLVDMFYYVMSLSTDWTVGELMGLIPNLILILVKAVWPVLLTALVVGTGANFLQVRALFTTETLKPQFSRISPISGAKRMFGVRAWVELAKSLFKVTVIGYFLYAAIRDNMEMFPILQRVGVMESFTLVGGIILDLAWKIAIAFLGLAVLDMLYQKWDFEKNLKMSHQEVKEEFKQTEGNPEVRSEIKRKQRSLAMQRMMQDLQKADVVVTNPTHFAVALRYDVKESKAPYVVAKGQDYVALRIKELAKEYDIVIMENKPLARALYAQVEIGQAIPGDLYKAVAEVLAFVYRLKKKRHTTA